MFRKVTFGLVSSALILSGLTGCDSNKEEYAKGIALYNKGDYESLIQARKFFNNYAAKHQDDKGVDEWFNKIDANLISQAKEKTNESFDNKDFKKAMEYVTVAKEGDPNDKETQKAYLLVKKSYDDQNKYDKFVNYLEARYIDTKLITEQWDAAVKSVETGKQPFIYLGAVAKVIYPQVAEVREIINAESFNLNGDDNAIFLEANTKLFEYTVSLEKELSDIMNLAGAESSEDYKDLAMDLNPESFNSTFIHLQEITSSYITEQDMEGKKKRNINNTLNFTAAYQRKLDNDKKATEKEAKEAVKQQGLTVQPQTTSPSTTTTPVTKTP